MKTTVENIVNKDRRTHNKHKKIELGFRWRVIPTGTQGKLKEEDLVRALHIECATEDYVLAIAILSDLYSATSVDFPGGIKMRLVPDIYGVTNPYTRAKVLHLRARQAMFLRKVMEMTSYEIASLDHPFTDMEGETATMRERLMWIQSTDRDYLPQFVNVASQYNGTGVVFTFIPQLETEARNMVASVIPLFRYHYGDSIKKYFKPDAWELQADTVWDPELNAAVSPDDRRVEAIEEQDPEFQWEILGEKDEVSKSVQRPPPTDKTLYGDDDGDSVSTFRTTRSNFQQQLEAASKPPKTDGDESSSVPPASQVTPSPHSSLTSARTPPNSNHRGTLISSTSSITSMNDETVHSRLSMLETSNDQNSLLLQMIMHKLDNFLLPARSGPIQEIAEDTPNHHQRTTEVVMTEQQYTSTSLHDEEPE
jgi:hypothetical protein